ncbi:aldehyde dehydrogenase family protein, partial [Rhizobium leguminosarum]|uniref:aldehyde dehydrogenase family protein n=1 Tax=Rhizobium leguminosarum TaxID=384 RepID=UPI003F9D5D86
VSRDIPYSSAACLAKAIAERFFSISKRVASKPPLEYSLDELLESIGAYMREWRTGDPLDPDNRIGALVSKNHFEKVKSFLDD